MLREESVVLAKWLQGVTLAVAHANPQDEHCASLEYHYGLLMWFQKCVVLILDPCLEVCYPRLRAAVFVNLVTMRSCMAKDRNPLACVMSDENKSILRRANFLLHSAHSSFPASNYP